MPEAKNPKLYDIYDKSYRLGVCYYPEHYKLNERKEKMLEDIASLKEIEDAPSSMISIYEAHEYLGYDLMNDREKNIAKVTKEDIIALSKKLKLDTIYLLEGVKENEEGN